MTPSPQPAPASEATTQAGAGRDKRTPDQHRAFLAFYAGVMRKEAAARQDRHPAFAAWLAAAADRADAEARGIAPEPVQLDLFGGLQ